MFGARKLSVFMGELALVPVTGDDVVSKAAYKCSRAQGLSLLR